MGKTVSYQRPDGKQVDAYLAEATTPDAPGIVVIQEWWGLNDQIRGVADRYAAAGYTALVPDLYRGKSTVEAAEAKHLMNDLDFGDAAGQDIRGAVQHLKQAGCAKVGVTGYCMGGALTLLAAVNVPEADAAVVWYGVPPLEYVDPARIRIPLMGHFATRDQAFPIGKVDELEQKLSQAGTGFEFHRYDAEHGFANETQVGPSRFHLTEYNPDAAALAWTRTLGFFERHLH
jgi:carboxymethylenebutenolidase